MKPIALTDNALFMVNWRERMRFPLVLSYVIVTVIVLLLTFMATYFQKGQEYNPRWPQESFWVIAVAQGILLLALGTISAEYAGARERFGGTLDFHRSSPTPRFYQVLGLTLGAPILEWCIFFMTLPVGLACGLIGGFSLPDLLRFYGSLAVCAYLFHITGIFFGLLPNRKRAASSRRAGGFQIFILLYIFWGIASTVRSSAMYHLTCYPEYAQFARRIWQSQMYYKPDEPSILLFTFYGVLLKSWILHLIVQVPLILLIWKGITRRISTPDRPILSKSQSICLIGFILFLYLGSTVSAFLEGPNTMVGYVRYRPVFEYGTSIMFMLFLSIFMGIIGAMAATPTQLLYVKGLRRIQKIGPKERQSSSDYSSNTIWLATFCLIVTTAYSVLTPWLTTLTWFDRLSSLVVILSYVVTFAAALEFFNLSKHFTKKSLFGVVMAIFWVFLPLFGYVTLPLAGKSDTYIQWFTASSPFTGAPAVLSPLVEPRSYYTSNGQDPAMTLFISLTVNLTLAGIALVLAARERRRLKLQIKKSA